MSLSLSPGVDALLNIVVLVDESEQRSFAGLDVTVHSRLGDAEDTNVDVQYAAIH